jgi:2-(1,2-epoxy-1,2-dihydrophenyl)acetyl-CoA isomerase
MLEYSTILFEVKDHVAHLTLNRPEAANSLNATVSAEMMDAVIRCEEDEEIRALVISGAGADLKGFYTPSDGLKSRISYFHATLSRLARADLPVVAAVNGAAAGAGMGLACACDLVIAAESARFIMAYARIGLSPDGGTTYFLPRSRKASSIWLRRAISPRRVSFVRVNSIVRSRIFCSNCWRSVISR